MSTETSYDSAPFGRVEPEKLGRLKGALIHSGKHPRAVEITGRCPRCSDDVHYVLHVREFDPASQEGGPAAVAAKAAGFTPSMRHPLSLGPVDVTLNCNCGWTHAPKPPDKGAPGCGAWFALEVTVDGDTVELRASRVPITLYEQQAAQARDSLAEGELQRVRTAAGNWRTGLLALVALVPTLVVVKGTDAVQNLSSTDKLVAGSLTAFGGALALAAALVSLRAAYGPLRRKRVLGRHGTAGAIPDLNEVETTAFLIQVARVMAVVSVMALGTAIGYVWAATPAPAAAAAQVVTFAD
jgi:hypothetical protein